MTFTVEGNGKNYLGDYLLFCVQFLLKIKSESAKIRRKKHLHLFTTNTFSIFTLARYKQMFKDWCQLNGWYDSEPPPEAPEEGADPVSVEPKWLAKGKALAPFCSAIAGYEELENLVHGFSTF